MVTTMPPGWYHGEGDPPGTHRYWNGNRWDSDALHLASPPPTATGPKVARKRDRLAALLLDGLVTFAVLLPLLLLAAIGGSASEGLASVVETVVVLAMVGVGLWNHIWLQGTTGQTIGKRRLGISLVRVDDGGVPGRGRMVGRWFLGSLLVYVFYVEYWWPLLDENNRRPSDHLLGLNVFEV